MAYLQFKVTGGAVHISAMASGGTESSNSVGTLSVNTTYHFWVNYLKGTGSNAKITAAFSTDGVRPTSGDNYVESTNGTATTNSARITLYGPYTTSSQCFDALYDKVRIDDALIGDNPS